MHQHKISDQLYLVHQPIAQTAPVPVDVPTNHVVVIDCSGSMSGDLPKIREQLKKKLPKMLREKDTISIVWFSSRGEFGTLLEAEPVATLTDLITVNAAIDRWLRPISMTGFVDPLNEVVSVVGRISSKSPHTSFSLFFMSDGYDNQNSHKAILEAVESVSGVVSSSTFVEYGYYADRNLLTQMAECAGGTLIFAQDFDQYAPSLESALQKRGLSAPRVRLEIKGKPVNGFVFSTADQCLTAYTVTNGEVLAPANLSSVSYISETSVTSVDSGSREKSLPSAYAALALYAQRMKSAVVFPILKYLGDVRLINAFSTCFGKQRYSEFVETVKSAVFNPAERLLEGFDPSRIPPDDAFTVLDMLRILSKDDGNRILIDDPAFKYSRIGRSKIDANEVLTKDELEQVNALTVRLAGEKSVKKIKEINDQIAKITSKPSALVFKADPSPDGYPISSLTLNEDRPNISILVKRPGTVDISARLSSGDFKNLDPSFPTSIYRNYTIVRDGLINVSTLPVRFSTDAENLFRRFVADGIIPPGTIEFGATSLIHLEKLPLINRQMIKEVTADSLFKKEYALMKARAEQKVLNFYAKDTGIKYTPGWIVNTYGNQVAEWLKEQGITDSGFSPKVVSAESTDFYLGKELSVSIKGYSKLPSIRDVQLGIAKGKLNGPGAIMADEMRAVDEFIASNSSDELVNEWISQRSKSVTKEVRRLMFDMAQIKFAIIVGQSWFSDLDGFDDNSRILSIDGKNLEFKVNLKEVEVKI